MDDVPGLWDLPALSTLIIVTGLEASGTKEVARIVAHRALACDYGLWSGLGSCIDKARGNAVLHRSLPHGAAYPDIDGIINKALARRFFVGVVVCSRDKTIALRSSLRAGHGDSHDDWSYAVPPTDLEQRTSPSTD